MLKIAITGVAGSGKSTVLKMFQDLGAPNFRRIPSWKQLSMI
jgi:dephospho-CoA kinase